jgi:hypothetical protein
VEMTGIDDNEAGVGHGGRATPRDHGGDGTIMTPSAIQQYRPRCAASRRQFLNLAEPLWID